MQPLATSSSARNGSPTRAISLFDGSTFNIDADLFDLEDITVPGERLRVWKAKYDDSIVFEYERVESEESQFSWAWAGTVPASFGGLAEHFGIGASEALIAAYKDAWLGPEWRARRIHAAELVAQMMRSKRILSEVILCAQDDRRAARIESARATIRYMAREYAASFALEVCDVCEDFVVETEQGPRDTSICESCAAEDSRAQEWYDR